jgi:hypothetical protein
MLIKAVLLWVCFLGTSYGTFVAIFWRTVHQVILWWSSFFRNFISSIIRFSFVPTCLWNVHQVVLPLMKFIFWELHLPFVFIWFPHILRNVVSLCDTSFDEVHFIETSWNVCLLSFVPHLLRNVHRYVNLMKFIFLGTWRNMCFHLFSQFEECSPCVKFDDFHFMGTLMQHVLLFQLLVLLLVSNCHEGPILGSTQWEDCVLFCLQGPNPPCLKIQVLTFVWPVY